MDKLLNGALLMGDLLLLFGLLTAMAVPIWQNPKNPWAHRNLEAMLLQTKQAAEAISHNQTATQ